MILVAIAFLCGTVFVHSWSVLPPVSVLTVLLALVAGGCAAMPRGRAMAALLFAIGWTWCVAHGRLIERVDPLWEGQDVVVTGVVSTIPVARERTVRFQLRVDELQFDGQTRVAPRTVLLTWFNPNAPVRAGERWRLTVRLKQPHGYANPGGFDFEEWLFASGIRAVGYVRDYPPPEKLARPEDFGARITALRQAMVERITSSVANGDDAAILSALVTGDQHAVTTAQWDVMLTTGTNHLISISGLHVALVAGLVFGASRRMVGWVPWLRATVPATLPAAVAAVAAAALYAALAGFAVPTQRSLLMIVVAMLATMWRRSIATSQGLTMSLLIVLAWDPFASLSASFWLSYAMVAVIFYVVSGRRKTGHDGWHYLRLHGWLALTSVPIVLCFFNQVSWLAPLANALAVPWVGFIVVPLALAGTALSIVGWSVGDGLLNAAAWNWHAIEWCLTQLLRTPGSHWFVASPPLWVCLIALGGVMLMMLPRALPARWLGVVAWLPMLLWRPMEPEHGHAWFSMLDVGQGLAAVVRTRTHVLVYDTGPRFSDTFDTGHAVVVPFLRQFGAPKLDMLIVGHGDNDHAGGAAAIVQAYPPESFLTSVPDRFASDGAQACEAGRRWEWDGVIFELLHPSPGQIARENDLSCVLRVQAGAHRVLLTGDIEHRAERQLIERFGGDLTADVLVAPHHGSKTSSTPEFIATVAPRAVLFPVGYRNRFGFPAAAVRERYVERGIDVYDSVHDGESQWRLGSEHIEHYSFRALNRHYWHWADGD